MIKMAVKDQLFTGLVLLSMHFVSCKPSFQASIDIAKDKQGNVGAYSQTADIGINIALGWTMGLNEGGSGSNSRGPEPGVVTEAPGWDPDDRPFEAQPVTNGQLAISPLIEFVQKGSKSQGVTTRENYLEGVADLQYRYPVSDAGNLYGGLGPYIAYGVGGKSGSAPYEIATFGGADGYKRFDAGLNVRAGYEFTNSLYVDLGYDFGLVDKSPTPSTFTARSRNFSFAVGYSVDKIIRAFKGH